MNPSIKFIHECFTILEICLMNHINRCELLNRLLQYLWDGGYPDNVHNALTDEQQELLSDLISSDESDIHTDLMVYHVVTRCTCDPN